MVDMGVGEDERTDPARVEAVCSDVLDDRLSPHPGSGINEHELVACVDEEDVTVVRIRQVEAHGARAHQMDPVCQFHSTWPRTVSIAIRFGPASYRDSQDSLCGSLYLRLGLLGLHQDDWVTRRHGVAVGPQPFEHDDLLDESQLRNEDRRRHQMWP